MPCLSLDSFLSYHYFLRWMMKPAWSSLPSLWVELLSERSRQISATSWSESLAQVPRSSRFSTLETLTFIHYTCPFGALLERYLLPLMGVSFWRFLSKYKKPAFGKGVCKSPGTHPMVLRKCCFGRNVTACTNPWTGSPGWLPWVGHFGTYL